MSVEKSIEQILQRAEQERENIISQINYLLDIRFIELLEDSKVIVQSYNEIAQTIGIKVNLKNTMEIFLSNNAHKLIEMEKVLYAFTIDENNAYNQFESLMGNAQSILEGMEPAIKEAKDNLLKELEKNIRDSWKRSLEQHANKQKQVNEEQEILKRINELENKKSYLQGKLDATKSRKSRKKLIGEIEEIDKQIELIKIKKSYTNKVNEELKNTISAPSNKGEAQTTNMPKTQFEGR